MTRKSLPKSSLNSRQTCAKRPKSSSSSALPNCATKRESCVRKCCKIGFMWRVLVSICLFTANVFGQAAAGNEKFDQKQYADAANAYERIPAGQRDTGVYNRLGISYHLTN